MKRLINARRLLWAGMFAVAFVLFGMPSAPVTTLTAPAAGGTAMACAGLCLENSCGEVWWAKDADLTWWEEVLLHLELGLQILRNGGLEPDCYNGHPHYGSG